MLDHTVFKKIKYSIEHCASLKNNSVLYLLILNYFTLHLSRISVTGTEPILVLEGASDCSIVLSQKLILNFL